MKRLMVLVPLLALALAGCSDMPKTWRKSEIEEIAADQAEDFADAGAADAGSRIDELEQRIAKLERENEAQDETIKTLLSAQGATFDYLLPDKQ